MVSRRLPILDAALDCVIVMDARGCIVELNASAEATFGRRRDEMIGQRLADRIIPARLRDAHQRALERYVGSREATVLGRRITVQAMRADGSEFPAEVTLSSAVIDGEQMFVGFVRDLSDRIAGDEERERARAEAADLADRLRRLQAATASLAAARSVSDVASAVLAAGVDAFAADTAVFVRPIDEATLGIFASVGVPEDVERAFHVIPRELPIPTALVFRTGQSQWVEDERTFRERFGTIAEALRTATSALAAVPLRVRGEVAAAVALRFAGGRRFSQSDRELLETFGTQAAVALERALAYEKEVVTREKLEALAELTSALANTMSEREVGEAILLHGTRAMRADTCMLYRVDADGALSLVAQRGCSEDIVRRLRRIDATSGNPSFKSVHARQSVWIETEAEYQAFFPGLADLRVEGPRAKAFWNLPLIVEGQPIGLLAMGYHAERRFPPEERAFIETFARSAAQALRRAQRMEGESRARSSLETTLRSIGDAVLATDAGGRVTFLNPVAESLTGWRNTEALGRPVGEVFVVENEETGAPAESPVDRVLRDGVVVGLGNHAVLVAKSGARTPIDDSGAPIRDGEGKLTGVVLVFRDVSIKKHEDRRRKFLSDAMSTLAASLDFETTLARVARLAVPTFADWCAVDVATDDGIHRVGVAHVDPAKVELARHLAKKYPPRPDAATGVPNVVRTGASELHASLGDDVLRAAAVDEEHLRLMRELQLRSAMVVPLTARGRVLGALTFVFAESGRRYGEEDLAFAEDLARRAATAVDNARLYSAEQEARRAADVANRVKDDFLATVSHELRTPLNAITGWAKMLGMAPADAARVAHAAATIERNGVAMAQLIDDLLDVSRIVAGKLRLDPEEIDLRRVADAAIESIRPAALAKGVRLEARIDGPSPMRGDPTRLQQVVWNLLSNAVKFSNEGGRVIVILTCHEASFELSVCDDGQGIAPDFLPYVFDPFRQADSRTTRRQGGLGLGLSITKQIIEMHGGRITAFSDGLGHGARFVVTLPRHAEEASNERSIAPVTTRFDRPRELEGVHVLVVDDDEDARDLLRMVLQECRCVVLTASSVRKALDVLGAERVDLLISDIGMPGEDGFELIRRVRKLPLPIGAIPAVAVTAYTRTEERRRVLEAGFTTHIPKPVEPAGLVAVLANFARASTEVDKRRSTSTDSDG